MSESDTYEWAFNADHNLAPLTARERQGYILEILTSFDRDLESMLDFTEDLIRKKLKKRGFSEMDWKLMVREFKDFDEVEDLSKEQKRANKTLGQALELYACIRQLRGSNHEAEIFRAIRFGLRLAELMGPTGKPNDESNPQRDRDMKKIYDTFRENGIKKPTWSQMRKELVKYKENLKRDYSIRAGSTLGKKGSNPFSNYFGDLKKLWGES